MIEDGEHAEPKFPKLSSSQAFEQIKQDPGSVEFELTTPIEDTDLRNSLSLPFELLFTEHNDAVILSANVGWRGFEDSLEAKWHRAKRVETSALMGHTHNMREDGPGSDTLSLQDLIVLESIDTKKTNVLLVTEKGISKFRKPIKDLRGNLINLDGSPANRDQYDQLAREFENEKDITIMTRRNIPESREGQAALSREFVERTGMLEDSASWDEADKIQSFVDQINLKKH